MHKVMVKGEKCCPRMFVTKTFLAVMVNAILKVGYSANLEGIDCHSQRKAFLSQNKKFEGNCKAKNTRSTSQIHLNASLHAPAHGRM